MVTDDAVVARPDFLARAAEVVRAGGRSVALHLRAPHASGRRVYELAHALAGVARESGALLLVNDRVDVAMAVGADGAHLGARSLAPTDARILLGPERWLGASVHSEEDAQEAAYGGANFVIAGAVYQTPSHPGRPPAGLAAIEIAASPGLPVIAIGGITPERVGEVRRAGAAGVAVVRGVWDEPDAGEAVRRYLGELT